MLTPLELVSSPPPNAFQTFKNDDERRDWFRRNIFWIIGHYDQKTYFSGEDVANVSYPVERIEKYFRYYLGRQAIPQPYRQTALTSMNTPLRTVWISGLDVGTLVDRLSDTGKTVINNMKITVKATSKKSQNERSRMLENLRTKMILKKDFEEFEQFGVAYKPVGNKDQEFQNLEEAERWANLDYQEESARWGQVIATDIWQRNHLKTEAATALLQTHIAGITAMHRWVYNGRVIVDRLDSDQIIRDPSNLYDPFNRKARFAGFVEWLDPSAVLARYSDQLSIEECEEIKTTTANTISQIIGMYGRMPGYMNNIYGIKYSKATVYWKGRRNLGWKEAKEDEWGHKAFYKTKDGEKGDYYDECVFQGTLIGNKYLVDIGVAPNQVKNPYNPGESELPIKIFTPNIVMGETMSVVSKLHQLQDLVDYYTNEIKKVIARNIGKVHVLYSDAFQGPVSPAAMLSDAENFGIVYINRKKGEPGFQDNRDNGKVSEVIDMTIDMNVQILAGLRAEQKQIMESIVSVTPIMTGSQKGYVSGQVQQNSIQQSNISALSVMNDFVVFLEMVMQDAANAGKIIHSMEDSNNEIPVAGDRGVTFLKETTQFSYEELGIEIKVLDIIDDAGKERLQGIALGLVQAQLFTMLDWAIVEKAQTYTEVLDYFMIVAKRHERDKEKQMAMQAEAQKVEAARQDQANKDSIAGKLQQTQMVVGEKAATAELKVEADLAKAGLQAGITTGQAQAV